MKNQIARAIFLKTLDTMKKILDLASFGFDCRTKQFKYFRSQVMEVTYTNLKKLFKELEETKLIVKCPQNCRLRQGYKKCLCGGSGWVNNE